MRLLSNIKELCVNFLFPRSNKILELEALTSGELLSTLPQAEQFKDKNSLAIFDYSHPLVREMIWQLKYGGNRKMASKLGEIAYDVLEAEISERNFEERWKNLVLVPIPISDKRRFERGWNQIELLCEEIHARDIGKLYKYLPRQLIKIRHTESQTRTSSRAERLKNINDSMKVINPEQVSGKCVIVIDDVTTTGSTFTEARRALRAAGAKKVLCIALAH